MVLSPIIPIIHRHTTLVRISMKSTISLPDHEGRYMAKVWAMSTLAPTKQTDAWAKKMKLNIPLRRCTESIPTGSSPLSFSVPTPVEEGRHHLLSKVDVLRRGRAPISLPEGRRRANVWAVRNLKTPLEQSPEELASSSPLPFSVQTPVKEGRAPLASAPEIWRMAPLVSATLVLEDDAPPVVVSWDFFRAACVLLVRILSCVVFMFIVFLV
jgi:hypothetical protein